MDETPQSMGWMPASRYNGLSNTDAAIPRGVIFSGSLRTTTETTFENFD